MKNQQTTKKKSIDSYIVSVIEEAIKSTLQNKALQEKEKQDSASKSSKDDDASGEESGEEKEKLKTGDVTVDDVIEKLNTIRAGKSFKDEKISAAFDKYFGRLDKEEKVALLAFLKGIAQVVSGEVQPQDTMDPSEKPADIEMKKTSGPQKVSIKPNVIKAPDIKKSEKKSSAEDTSGPVPITPKKK